MVVRIPRLLVVLAVAVLKASPLGAQCPDGTPPRCGIRRPPPAPTVAVLYFDNRSADTADAYLADGLTEELTARLGQVERLSVKSRRRSCRSSAGSKRIVRAADFMSCIVIHMRHRSRRWSCDVRMARGPFVAQVTECSNTPVVNSSD